MAHAIGDIVYRHYAPQKPGKVVATRMAKQPGISGTFQRVTVKFLDGSVQEEPEWHFRSLPALIADHHKKIASHTAALQKAQAIV